MIKVEVDDEPVLIPSDDDNDCIPIAEKIIKQEILIDDENKPFTRTKTVKRYIYSSGSEGEEKVIKKRTHSDSDTDFAPFDSDSDVEYIDCDKPKKRPKTKSKEPRNVTNQARKRKADKKDVVPKKKIKSEKTPKKKIKTEKTPKKKIKTEKTPKKKIKSTLSSKTCKELLESTYNIQKQEGNEILQNLLPTVTLKEELCETDVLVEENVQPEHTDLEKDYEGNKQENVGSKKALPRRADMYWKEAELLSELQDINVEVAQNVINLFDTDNTIPFIARYRKELTGNMEAEKLRHVKESYEYIRTVKQKAIFVMNNIAKMGKLTPDLEKSIKCCRSINEIEHFYAPYKTGRTGTLADRARKLGLEAPAMTILNGEDLVSCTHLVKPGVEGLSTIQEVISGCQHIIADAMSKDEGLIAFIRDLRKILNLRLECKKAQKRSAPSKDEKKNKTAAKIKNEKLKSEEDENKFANYFNFAANVNYVKPHQFCKKNWMCRGKYYPFRETLLEQSCKDAYNRLIEPLIVRQVRAELLQKAECAAIEVFASNLKALLLAPPLRGKTILGIDPGFRNGCKLAVISTTGEVIRTDVIYPHTSKDRHPEEDPDAQKLRDIISTTKCDVIALGNGTACRETEQYLAGLISGGWFKPLDISYVIVAEEGASIYSCSPLAKKEFPTMDPNLISAVSLARRLQDPMAELVKVEPKHLGVGMYQHDVPEKKLMATLDEIVSECVSFVGVDINTASDCILRHVAGLSAAKVKSVIEWRSTRGPFINRNQLKLVKGIGNKTFEQCAGFIRVMPQTLNVSERKNLASLGEKPNVLDQTWIHPESYGIVDRFLRLCSLKLEDFGKPEFVNRVHEVIAGRGIANVSSELECSESQLQLIADALQKPPGHDLRITSNAPLFRKSINTMESLHSGQLVTGCVRNVTHFGAFVDIGVGQNGLIHNSAMKGVNLSVGQKVEVAVLRVDIVRKRIGLELRSVL